MADDTEAIDTSAWCRSGVLITREGNTLQLQNAGESPRQFAVVEAADCGMSSEQLADWLLQTLRAAQAFAGPGVPRSQRGGSDLPWDLVDWRLLLAQKLVVQEYMQQLREEPRVQLALSGLLSLLDSVQDAAAAVLGETAVFPPGVRIEDCDEYD